MGIINWSLNCFSGSKPVNTGCRIAWNIDQKCTSEGIWRQGIVLKHRNSLQKSLCPVVICPYLCSSELTNTQSRVATRLVQSESSKPQVRKDPYCRCNDDNNNNNNRNNVSTIVIIIIVIIKIITLSLLKVICSNNNNNNNNNSNVRSLGKHGRLDSLRRTTFWCGLSNHQAATAQMHLVEKTIVECRPALGALPLALNERTPCVSAAITERRAVVSLAPAAIQLKPEELASYTQLHDWGSKHS